MAAQSLQRLLGKGFSIAACVGLVIGLGIMRTPGEIAIVLNDPFSYMALWIACGAFVLVSLLVVAELIAMTPRSGGIYALVAHAYGRYPGFLIGWTDWFMHWLPTLTDDIPGSLLVGRTGLPIVPLVH